MRKIRDFGLPVSALLLASCAALAYAKTAAVLQWPGHRMFEDFSARSQVSPYGRYVLRTFVDGNQALLKLPGGADMDAMLHGRLQNFEQAVWCGNGLLRLGTFGGSRHWFSGDRTPRPVGIPPDAYPACDRTGKLLAYFRVNPPRAETTSPKTLYIGNRKAQKQVTLEGAPLTARFSPDGRTLYVLARQDDGASLLTAISLSALKPAVLARNLDAWPFPGPELAVTANGSALIVPLATLSPPDNPVRQIPHEPQRWLKLYRFDLRTHAFTLMHARPYSDQTDPAAVGKDLYWVSSHTTKRVDILPAGGGKPRVLLPGQDGYLPSWSRDGKHLAFVTGEFRLVDWGLPQDIDVVDMDGQGRTAGAIRPFIVGNNEDFSPDWSPNGKWVVWHSHRDSTADPPYYGAPGTTDDIWIRGVHAPESTEAKVTNGLWETGWAYWSPDGRQIIYTTWDHDGAPGIYHVRTMTMDPVTGRPLGEHRFPMPPQVHSPEIAIWSPSGKEIAVEDAVSPTENVLWVVSVDGTKLTKLATYRDETYGGLDWSPDGKTLVFAGLIGDRMQILSVPRAGGPIRQLSSGPGNYMHPRISPDGRWIACSQLETVQTLLRDGP
jgi:Tol biopolymer transport system component